MQWYLCSLMLLLPIQWDTSRHLRCSLVAQHFLTLPCMILQTAASFSLKVGVQQLFLSVSLDNDLPSSIAATGKLSTKRLCITQKAFPGFPCSYKLGHYQSFWRLNSSKSCRWGETNSAIFFLFLHWIELKLRPNYISYGKITSMSWAHMTFQEVLYCYFTDRVETYPYHI